MDLKIGSKLKALRLSADLTQHELADRARLTKGFISQLENDQTSISLDSLADILEALGVSLTDFFDDKGRSRIVFGPTDRIAISDTGAARFELLVAGSTNSIMDPAMILLRPGQKMKKQPPQPGEQFGYVIRGTATITIGKESHKVPSRHCFYMESGKTHQIANKGTTEVSMLLITSPPLR